MKKWFFSLLLGVFLLLVPGMVYAIDNPDLVVIEEVYVFDDLIETGDQLYYVRYDVNYNVTPEEDPGDTWEMALYRSTGSLVGIESLNYYNHHIISMYLNSTQALTWQGSHQVKIRGKPLVFENLTEDVNMDTWSLSPGDYLDGSYLGGELLVEAQILEDDWGVTLISNGLLNETGRAFFGEAIPGLDEMAPGIFESVVSGVDVNYESYNHTYRETLSENQGDRLSGAVSDIGKIMGVYNSEWTSFWLVSIFLLLIMGTMSSGVGMPGWAFIGGYSVLAVCAYIFGGGLFTLVIVLGVIVAAIFGLYFILSRFA